MAIEFNKPSVGQNRSAEERSGVRTERGRGTDKSAGEAVTTANSSAEQQDRVSLTDTAARMQGLENTVANLPVVDSDKVDGIQKALADGSFEVNAERIADKMLRFERDFGA